MCRTCVQARKVQPAAGMDFLIRRMFAEACGQRARPVAGSREGGGMHLVDVLLRHGGVASRSQLPGSARQLKKLVDSGAIVRLAPGRFALPAAADALRAATRLQGTMSHRSAATYWGWELKTQPPRPEVIVPASDESIHSDGRGCA